MSLHNHIHKIWMYKTICFHYTFNLKSGLLFLLLFFFITSGIIPQSIQTIDTKGSKAFSKSEILSWTGIPIGLKTFKGIEDSIKFRLARNFADRGYVNSTFDISLTVIDTQKADLNI